VAGESVMQEVDADGTVHSYAAEPLGAANAEPEPEATADDSTPREGVHPTSGDAGPAFNVTEVIIVAREWAGIALDEGIVVYSHLGVWATTATV
jgi:hypothetical protein